jgi:hypothetical protein
VGNNQSVDLGTLAAQNLVGKLGHSQHDSRVHYTKRPKSAQQRTVRSVRFHVLS